MILRLLLIFLATSVYTYTRYVVFGGVPHSHVPLYLMNKSVSMAAAVFLFMTALHEWKANPEATKFWGTAALHGAFLHIVMSFCILTQDYYPKFFGDDGMNLIGELSMLFGVLAAYCFWCISRVSHLLLRREALQVLACVFLAVHVLVMGFQGWSAVSKWYGAMPPISLVSFGFAVAAFALFLRCSTRQSA